MNILFVKGILNSTGGRYSLHQSLSTVLCLNFLFLQDNSVLKSKVQIKETETGLPHTTLPPADPVGEFRGPNKPVQSHVGDAGPGSGPGEYVFRVFQRGTGYEAEIAGPVAGQLELETQSWIHDPCSEKKQEQEHSSIKHIKVIDYFCM